MDVKVKSMIKLIEEDADSYSRKAEMYYKKRPELMKLVEEFYRAYRALAERYDHATGALRHAHRTMSEAFSNHIPLALPDESLFNNTLEMTFLRSAVSDSDDLPNDAFCFPEPFIAFDRKEASSEENEALATNKGLKIFDELFIPCVKLHEESLNVQNEEGAPSVRLPEWRIRKSLDFQDEDENTPTSKIHIDSKILAQSENTEKENANSGIKDFQEQVSQLSSENQRLTDKIELESKHLNISRAHVQYLRGLKSKLESEKDAALLQNQLSDEIISSLEIEISKVKTEIRKLNEEMKMAVMKLNAAEKQCLALEKSNTDLIAQKNDLISQIERIKIFFINLETKNATFEEEHLNLVNEKYFYDVKVQELENSLSFLQKELGNKLCILQENRQVREELEAANQKSFSLMTEISILQTCLFDTSFFCIIEKQKHKSLIQSKEVELSVLESQIQFLQEEKMDRDNKLKEEEKKSMNFMVKISNLQNYLSEMKGENSTISQVCQRLLESSRSADEQIKHLEERDIVQKENISFLMNHIFKVRDGIQLLLRPLNINHELMNFDGSEAVIISTILREIYNLLASNSIFNDENQLLKQTELEKILLGQEIEEVKRNMLVLKAELESLTKKLKDSLEDLKNFREENDTLEVENDFICIEAMTQEHLYLFFRSLNGERIQQLKFLNDDMFSLITIQNGLFEEIRDSKKRERSLVYENKQLGESLALLKELITRTAVLEFDVCTALSICEELTLQVEDRDEKMFELTSRYEGLEISVMVQQETLKEVVASKHLNEVELKKKLDDFENENGSLRTNFMALSPLFVSLGNGISRVEEIVCQLAKLHGNQESPSHQPEDHETSIVDHDHSAAEGVCEMQNLIAKVESFQKLVMGAKSHLDQKKLHSDTSLESAKREIEDLKLKESSIREVNQRMDLSTPSMVKDIELDQVSNSFGFSRIQSSESNDQMLKLWESPDRDFENWISIDHDKELVEEVKSQKPSSELVDDKYLGVYKLRMTREIKESQDEWNRMAIKRLAIHANKLSALHTSAQELKLKMERSDTRVHHNKLQFDTIRAGLKDAEAAISELLVRNSKLTLMTELYANSFNDKEIEFTERKQASEHIRSGSERIGMLELELQKIDYIFLKLEEESESYSTSGRDRTPRMSLRDYLYGRNVKKGKKRDRFCWCVRARTNDD